MSLRFGDSFSTIDSLATESLKTLTIGLFRVVNLLKYLIFESFPYAEPFSKVTQSPDLFIETWRHFLRILCSGARIFYKSGLQLFPFCFASLNLSLRCEFSNSDFQKIFFKRSKWNYPVINRIRGFCDNFNLIKKKNN